MKILFTIKEGKPTKIDQFPKDRSAGGKLFSYSKPQTLTVTPMPSKELVDKAKKNLAKGKVPRDVKIDQDQIVISGHADVAAAQELGKPIVFKYIDRSIHSAYKEVKTKEELATLSECMIYATKGAFLDFFPENRERTIAHVAKIIKSLFVFGNLSMDLPILIDRNGRIIEGQHRYTGTRNAGMPIYFKIASQVTSENIAMINSMQRRWVIRDYVHSLAVSGNKFFKGIQDLQERVAVEAFGYKSKEAV